MKSAGIVLLSKLIKDQDTEEFHNLALKPEYFVEQELEYYEFVQKHVMTYGQLPALVTFEKTLEWSIPACPESTDYYVDQLQSRFMKGKIQEVLVDLGDMFKNPVAPTSKEVVSKISEVVLDFNINMKHKNLFDFRESQELIWQAYKKKQMNPEGGALFGWPSFDNVSGGLTGGDVVSFIGRPGAGKSYVMLKVAEYMWRHQGLTPLFITMEMSASAMFNRLTAIHTGLTINNINKGKLSTEAFGKMSAKMIAMQDIPNPFWLLDGGSKTIVEDIVLACHQLKPDVVFVDGAYLLRHKNTRLDKWSRMSDNADLLKFDIARDFDIPAILSYQFGKESVKKKKKGERFGLEDIYGSDTIAQVSSIVMGLLEEESVETVQKRRLDILKGREGETGDFSINWNFNYMDFSEMKAQEGELIKYF